VTSSTGGVGTATTYNLNAGFPYLSAYRDGNLQIDFNVTSADSNGLFLDFNLSSTNATGGGDTNIVIYADLNLGARALPGQSSNLCDSNVFTSRVNCRIDLNIQRGIIANDGNYFIRMRIYDINNTGGAKPAGAANDTNISTNSLGIDNIAPNLTWDGNHATWQTPDANVVLTCTDRNSTNGDSNRSGCGTIRYRTDTDATSTVTMPSTFSDFDSNVLIGFSGDGNYALDWNVTDNAGNLASSNSVPSGTTDYNRTYVQIDKTTPTATITNTGGNGGSTTTTGLNFTLVYTSSDGSGSGVDTYWVSSNNSTWTNNSTATTYTYSITGATPLPHIVTLYLIGNDGVDKNSTTVTFRVTFQSGSGGGGGSEICGDGVCRASETTATCPADCVAVCGDAVCTGNESSATCPQDCVEGCGNTVCEEPTETCRVCPTDCGICNYTSEETVDERTLNEQPTQADVQNVLLEAGFTQSDISNAAQWLNKVSVERSVTVTRQSTNDGVSQFVTRIAFSIENTGSSELRGVKVVEQIPKEVAFDAALISSDLPFVILKQDPIVQFTIPSIAPNARQEVVYSVRQSEALSDEALNSFLPPIVLTATPIASQSGSECRTDSDCDDSNLCTNNRCVNNRCAFVPVENGSVCGFGKECQSGVCAAATTQKSPAGGNQMLILAGALVVLIIALGFYAKQKTPRKPK